MLSDRRTWRSERSLSAISRRRLKMWQPAHSHPCASSTHFPKTAPNITKQYIPQTTQSNLSVICYSRTVWFLLHQQTQRHQRLLGDRSIERNSTQRFSVPMYISALAYINHFQLRVNIWKTTEHSPQFPSFPPSPFLTPPPTTTPITAVCVSPLRFMFSSHKFTKLCIVTGREGSLSIRILLTALDKIWQRNNLHVYKSWWPGIAQSV